MIRMTFSPAEQRRFKEWTKFTTRENQKECRRLIIRATQMFERYAKMDAPVNKEIGQGGRLRSSIHASYSPDGLGSTVSVPVHYAPYMEFGTGRYVKILPGYEPIAAQFKGRGIREVNLRPRAFFYHNFERVNKAVIAELRKMGFTQYDEGRI